MAGPRAEIRSGGAEAEGPGQGAALRRPPDPERGDVDLRTLHHLQAYRGDTDSPEPLPFGVYATVERAGRIRLGDPVAVTGPGS
ncbi:MAG: hypothetical protein IPK93_03425 [Solirubrobacterales bacterium]|nr:hypothetical protein [Solirubrobacterales bacterium]